MANAGLITVFVKPDVLAVQSRLDLRPVALPKRDLTVHSQTAVMDMLHLRRWVNATAEMPICQVLTADSVTLNATPLTYIATGLQVDLRPVYASVASWPLSRDEIEGQLRAENNPWKVYSVPHTSVPAATTGFQFDLRATAAFIVCANSALTRDEDMDKPIRTYRGAVPSLSERITLARADITKVLGILADISKDEPDPQLVPHVIMFRDVPVHLFNVSVPQYQEEMEDGTHLTTKDYMMREMAQMATGGGHYLEDENRSVATEPFPTAANLLNQHVARNQRFGVARTKLHAAATLPEDMASSPGAVVRFSKPTCAPAFIESITNDNAAYTKNPSTSDVVLDRLLISVTHEAYRQPRMVGKPPRPATAVPPFDVQNNCHSIELWPAPMKSWLHALGMALYDSATGAIKPSNESPSVTLAQRSSGVTVIIGPVAPDDAMPTVFKYTGHQSLSAVGSWDNHFTGYRLRGQQRPPAVSNAPPYAISPTVDVLSQNTWTALRTIGTTSTERELRAFPRQTDAHPVQFAYWLPELFTRHAQKPGVVHAPRTANEVTTALLSMYVNMGRTLWQEGVPELPLREQVILKLNVVDEQRRPLKRHADNSTTIEGLTVSGDEASKQVRDGRYRATVPPSMLDFKSLMLPPSLPRLSAESRGLIARAFELDPEIQLSGLSAVWLTWDPTALESERLMSSLAARARDDTLGRQFESEPPKIRWPPTYELRAVFGYHMTESHNEAMKALTFLITAHVQYAVDNVVHRAEDNSAKSLCVLVPLYSKYAQSHNSKNFSLAQDFGLVDKSNKLSHIPTIPGCRYALIEKGCGRVEPNLTTTANERMTVLGSRLGYLDPTTQWTVDGDQVTSLSEALRFGQFIGEVPLGESIDHMVKQGKLLVFSSKDMDPRNPTRGAHRMAVLMYLTAAGTPAQSRAFDVFHAQDWETTIAFVGRITRYAWDYVPGGSNLPVRAHHPMPVWRGNMQSVWPRSIASDRSSDEFISQRMLYMGPPATEPFVDLTESAFLHRSRLLLHENRLLTTLHMRPMTPIEEETFIVTSHIVRSCPQCRSRNEACVAHSAFVGLLLRTTLQDLFRSPLREISPRFLPLWRGTEEALDLGSDWNNQHTFGTTQNEDLRGIYATQSAARMPLLERRVDEVWTVDLSEYE